VHHSISNPDCGFFGDVLVHKCTLLLSVRPETFEITLAKTPRRQDAKEKISMALITSTYCFAIFCVLARVTVSGWALLSVRQNGRFKHEAHEEHEGHEDYFLIFISIFFILRVLRALRVKNKAFPDGH
jgi:hypothetical protein